MLVFDLKIDNHGEYGPRRTISYIPAQMTVVTQRGDKWVPAGASIAVKLKFTALPNSKIYSVPGTQFKVAWTPQTVKRSAVCIGGICSVASRASGGKFLNMEMQVMEGRYEIMSTDGKSGLNLNQFNASGDTALPYAVYSGTDKSDMPTQRSFGLGVGVTTTGRDPEEPTHIITGPSIGSLSEPPKMLKAEGPKH